MPAPPSMGRPSRAAEYGAAEWAPPSRARPSTAGRALAAATGGRRAAGPRRAAGRWQRRCRRRGRCDRRRHEARRRDRAGRATGLAWAGPGWATGLGCASGPGCVSGLGALGPGWTGATGEPAPMAAAGANGCVGRSGRSGDGRRPNGGRSTEGCSAEIGRPGATGRDAHWATTDGPGTGAGAAGRAHGRPAAPPAARTSSKGSHALPRRTRSWRVSRCSSPAKKTRSTARRAFSRPGCDCEPVTITTSRAGTPTTNSPGRRPAGGSRIRSRGGGWTRARRTKASSPAAAHGHWARPASTSSCSRAVRRRLTAARTASAPGQRG